jgi:hypothetical protein
VEFSLEEEISRRKRQKHQQPERGNLQIRAEDMNADERKQFTRLKEGVDSV